MTSPAPSTFCPYLVAFCWLLKKSHWFCRNLQVLDKWTKEVWDIVYCMQKRSQSKHKRLLQKLPIQFSMLMFFCQKDYTQMAIYDFEYFAEGTTPVTFPSLVDRDYKNFCITLEGQNWEEIWLNVHLRLRTIIYFYIKFVLSTTNIISVFNLCFCPFSSQFLNWFNKMKCS